MHLGARLLCLIVISMVFGISRGEISTCPPEWHCDPRFYGFSPRVGTVTSGSHIAFGGAYQWQAPGEQPLDWEVSGLYSVRNYQRYEARIGRLRTRRRTFLLDPFGRRITSEFHERYQKKPGLAAFADFSYFSFPAQNFFGLGPDSRREDRTDFALQGAAIEGVFGYQITDWLGTSVRAGFLQFDLDEGHDDRYTNTSVLFPAIPGLDRQPDFYRFSSAILADYRDVPIDPQRGGITGLHFAHYRERGGSDFVFNRFAIDVRQYIPVESLLSVIALRFFSSMDDPVGDAQVPFYLAATLGGGSALRGFSTHRFRDRNLLLLSAEYRVRLTETIEIAAFYDTGKTFSRSGDYDLRALQKAYGGGFRLKGGPILFLRIAVGHSREGTQLHLNAGPAF